MAISIDRQITRLRDRKAELQRELERIEQIEADLERTVEEALRTIGAASSGALSGARAAVRAERAKPARKPARKASGTGQRGRPKGSGKRQAQAVKIIASAPGIRTSEVAKKMGIGPNYLYRLLPDLEKVGEITKRGNGWYPGSSNPSSDGGSAKTAS